MEKCISINDLSVVLKGRNILDFDRNISISNGDTVAILGPNGAGKSTLINCIIGQLPFSGSITINKELKNLGILFQENEYGDLIKVNELICLVTQKNKSDDLVQSMIDEFNLAYLLNTRISKLSKGELQRLSLALVLSRNPDFFIFDELTTGLDFEKRVELLNLVKSKTKNKTVILVTHYFEEISSWANKILLLDGGKIVFWGSVSNFEKEYSHLKVLLISKDHISDVRNEVSKLDGVCLISNYENSYCAAIVLNDDGSSIEDSLNKQGIKFASRPSDFYSFYRLALEMGEKNA